MGAVWFGGLARILIARGLIAFGALAGFVAALWCVQFGAWIVGAHALSDLALVSVVLIGPLWAGWLGIKLLRNTI